MFGILFRIEARPGKYQELLEFLKWDGEVCRDREPGTVRFEFHRDPNDENAFFVYEAYHDFDAFEAHKKNEPFQRWSSRRETRSGPTAPYWFLAMPYCPPADRHRRGGRLEWTR